jgi:hypothetical protein
VQAQLVRSEVGIELLRPVARLCRQDTIWRASEVPGTEVAEVWHRELGWDRERRLVLVRHRVAEKERPGGKKLLHVPGYLFQAFVTNVPACVPPIEVWREYNPRAGCEGVINQPRHDDVAQPLAFQQLEPAGVAKPESARISRSRTWAVSESSTSSVRGTTLLAQPLLPARS